MKDIYDFYYEISFAKVFIWIVYSFLWLIMVCYFLVGTRAGFFDAVIDRTNKVLFCLFWGFVYISVYIYLYIQVFKKNTKILKCCALCFVSVVIVNMFFWGTHKLAIFSFREFSSENWLVHKNERHYMVDDLVKNAGIIGMNVEDVNKLLGEPDGYYSSGLIYWSGGYNIVFWIDDNDKISEYSMW